MLSIKERIEQQLPKLSVADKKKIETSLINKFDAVQVEEVLDMLTMTYDVNNI